MCYGKGKLRQHDYTKCAVYAADKKEYFKLHPERAPKEKRIEIQEDHGNCQHVGGPFKDRHLRQIGDVAESRLQAGQQLQ